MATAGDAYITIPGAYVGIYGGGTLSDDTGPTAETTSGTVHAYGKPLTIRVNTYGVDSSSTLGKYLSQNIQHLAILLINLFLYVGFDLIYNQLPCGTNMKHKHVYVYET